MNTWLVGFNTEISGVEVATHVLIQAESLTIAEAAAMYMGCTWWPDLQKDDGGYRWQFPGGIVWFNSILLLDDVENTILHGLKFLDTWIVSGTPESPVVRDEFAGDWFDYTR
ncbi:TPA: hypothetical protein ACLFOO_004353 [Yersinia enterocolitica]|jgi:hypothetical protein|uniref:hypothetical protein n=1 Tax=Yersinia TaxID=629 RepID=UPI0005E3653C|nr:MULTISPECIES: hypothetical protein [Yersinia]RXA93770.1 hypothetical protein EQP49_22350 [Yersinia sp. 2105 StPb PI]CFB71329.1 Uncharacterised protein [Yersinia enterocolitica]HDL6679558.1 hypothetical protein [Yersinia enterocolitica]HDL8230371.1 hypothetical protein [Yersinia enterocolitica]HDX8417490.1 hypothetical protein [Yersinia enterocolitica]